MTSKIEDGGPAFPGPNFTANGHPNGHARGLSLRDWSWHDLIVDHVRGFGPREGGLSSVQGTDQCLCPKCTRTVDAFVTEDRNATDDEIEEALAE